MLKEIVFTGGPCGGKTTAMKNVKWELEKRGYKVFSVPEGATSYMDMGLDIAGGIMPDRNSQMQINERYALNREIVRGWAKYYERAVILYDRYVMDGIAYYNGNYNTLLRDQGLDWYESCQWPDLVIHMVSPALDKPKAYNWDNPHRYSSIDRAISEDKKIMQAWVSHSHFRVVGNEGDFFSNKLDKVLEHVIHVVKNDELERKFLVKSVVFDEKQMQAHATKYIEQIYIKDTRYSRCTWRGQCTYQMAMKKGEGIRRTEFEEWMTPLQWSNVVKNAKHPLNEARYLNKTRDNFVWNNRFYELDSCLGLGYFILEIELTDEDEKYALPPFMEVVREVTDEPEYMSKNLAKPKV